MEFKYIAIPSLLFILACGLGTHRLPQKQLRTRLHRLSQQNLLLTQTICVAASNGYPTQIGLIAAQNSADMISALFDYFEVRSLKREYILYIKSDQQP